MIQDALEQIVVRDDSGYFGNDGGSFRDDCANVFGVQLRSPAGHTLDLDEVGCVLGTIAGHEGLSIILFSSGFPLPE